MRFFNTTGPVVPADHYCIPPLERLDLDDVLGLIHDKRYFVLHAPRQTGKTSTLLALRDLLNSGVAGGYRCVYVNVEAGQAAREDVGQAMRAILSALATWARSTLHDDFLGKAWRGILAESGPHGALGEALTRWSEADPRAAGSAHRRDRRAGGRHPAVGAAPAPGGIRPAPAGLSTERHPVRRARRA